MAMDMEQVISKVEKLLALGTSSNEHEAALAVSKAQDLMMQYGLAMEQVTGRKANRSDVKEADAFDVFEEGKTTAWRMEVLSTVARTSGVWIARGYRSELVESKHAKHGSRYANYRTAYFIGLPGDVELAGYAYSFLVAEVERLAQEYANVHWAAIRSLAKDEGITVHNAEARYVWRTGSHPLKAKASWTKGAAQGVISMLVDEYRSRQANAGEAGSALVLNRDAVIRDYWYMKQYGMTYEEKVAADKERNAKWAAEHPSGVAKPLTPAQIRRQQERDERAWRREADRRQRAEARKWASMDIRAYNSGYDTGRKMSVRSGVGTGTKPAPALKEQ